MAADHHTGGASLGDDRSGALGGGNVAVGQDGAAHLPDRPGNEIVVHLSAIHCLHGAAVDGEQIDLVPVDDLQEAVEALSVIKAEAHLDREESGHGGAERPQNLVDPVRIAQQPAADVFAIDLGCGAAEIEIDAGHRKPQQFAHGAQDVGHALADELGEHRPAGGVVGNGPQDVFLRP